MELQMTMRFVSTAIFLTLSTTTSYCIAQPTIQSIISYGHPSPDGEGVLAVANFVSIKNDGEVLFLASIDEPFNDLAIWSVKDSIVRQIVGVGDSLSNSSQTITSVGLFECNENGQIVFGGSLAGQSGIFLAERNELFLLARVGDMAPGGAGTFTTFENIQINESGGVVFFSELNSGESGIYQVDLDGVTTIAETGQQTEVGGHNNKY